MSETVQIIIVSAVIILAGVGLFRALRRKKDCTPDRGCTSCPLSDNCHKSPSKKD
ncbi:MAG: hypothetical protein K2M00_00630 [Muribaculaceae bacterium]|nr:hypothetical protein [Muribaculaceae bacterium]